MKRFLAVLVAVLALTSVAFAAPTLPNYKMDGKLVKKVVCDNGATTMLDYHDSDDSNWTWSVHEIRTGSGDILLEGSAQAEELFVKAAGSSEMKSVSHKEFDDLLQAKAPAMYNRMHSSGANDCN